LAAFIAALKRYATQKKRLPEGLLQTSIQKLYPKIGFAELHPESLLQAATEKQIPQQLAPYVGVCAADQRETEFHKHGYLYSVRYRIFGRVHNLREEFQAKRSCSAQGRTTHILPY
jgi:hypothetical protein